MSGVDVEMMIGLGWWEGATGGDVCVAVVRERVRGFVDVVGEDEDEDEDEDGDGDGDEDEDESADMMGTLLSRQEVLLR